jgi:predicted dehydrogenase
MEPKNMEPFKTAILGFGRHGAGLHLAEITANPAFALTAVCDTDPERFAKAPDSTRTYQDYREMLRAEELDLVIVTTRSDQHCPMTCDCLAAGLNVMVTKPWALNTAEAQRMIAAAEKSPGTLYPWLPSFWAGDLAYLRNQLADQAVGKPFLFRLIVSNFSLRDDWQVHTKYGGGYLLNWGPHLVYKAVLAAGGLNRVQSVYGNLRNIMHPGDAEDVYSAMLTMQDGTQVCVERTVAPLEQSLWIVQGDRGMILLRDDKATVIRATPRRPTDPTATAQPASEEASEQNDFIAASDLYGNTHAIYEALDAAMKGQEDFPVTCTEALQLTRLLDAIRRSAESNRVVEPGSAAP